MDRKYIERLLRRLERQYVEGKPLPAKDDNADDLIAAGVAPAATMDRTTAFRWARFIRAEGYGDGQ